MTNKSQQKLDSKALIITGAHKFVSPDKTKQMFALLLACTCLSQTMALSLISEKCDPSKVGPDETTVKGGWQAEMFNGLTFRTCGK